MTAPTHSPKRGRARIFRLGPLVSCLALFVASCSSPQVEVRARPLTNSAFLRALANPDTLSAASSAFLREEGLDREYRRDPEGTLKTLWAREKQRPSGDYRLVVAEILVNRGEDLTDEEPRKAIGYFIEAARLWAEAAWTEGALEKDSPYRRTYNFCCGEVAKLLYDQRGAWTAPLVQGGILPISGPFTDFQLAGRIEGLGTINPTYFDEALRADRMEFKGIEMRRIVNEGIGAAMVGHRKRTEERRAEEPFLGSTGLALPINALLRFPNNDEQVILELRDLLMESTAPSRGRPLPLSADFSAPIAFHYNFAPKGNVGLRAMLKPGEYKGEIGLFYMEPFRKNKIPIVFVHGLMSSPATWTRIMNMLRADPILRRDYQFLVFRYSSGYRIGDNAASLREALAAWMEHVDPKRIHPSMRQVVLVGHSMGGMLSNIQIRDSGNQIHDHFFDKPIDQLGLSSEEQQALLKRYRFSANPDVNRAIFIASPHRGSKFAATPIGRLGAFLIRFPGDFLVASLDSALALGGANPDASRVLLSYNNSVRSLRPDNPILPIVLELPVGDHVSYHSIIAQNNVNVPLEKSNDKVVPYTSAHLEGAASEAIILKANHTSVLTRPETAEELRRLLYVHKGRDAPREPLALPSIEK